MIILRYRIFLIGIFLVVNSLHGQPDKKKEIPLSRILFVFDGSKSMSGYWESDIKINIARKLLISIVDSLQDHEKVQMALRVYGHQSPVPPQDCDDTKLEVSFGTNNASIIRQKLRYIAPKGTTPIAYALEQAANDFPPCDDCRNIVILITDGIEACEGDPCKVSNELLKKGIILKPFVIGIGIDEGFKESFNCIGHYYNAINEKKFQEVLKIVINQALNQTTAQVNLLDIEGNPSETNVNMTFFDRYSGQVKHNYIHTINHRGNPDTIYLDPLITYKMKVHTIPPIEKDSIKIIKGKHSILAVDAPQGSLYVTARGTNLYKNQQLIVRKAGEMQTLNVQKINQKVSYLVGNYDIEIPILPRLYIDDVKISQSHTTTVEIPRPGMLNLVLVSPGIGSLYVCNGEAIEWIYNINPDIRNETIILLPGKYLVVYRPRNAKQTYYTVYEYFEIKEGGSTLVELR